MSKKKQIAIFKNVFLILYYWRVIVMFVGDEPIHINAKKGTIAPLVLMPGDPLRAKYIAEHFL